MFFRFGSAVILVVLIGLAGAALERQNLELRRRISRQEFLMSVLQDRRAEITLRVQQLGAPRRVVETLNIDPAQVQ